MARVVCGRGCMWKGLYVERVVCGKGCMWQGLYVARAVSVCDLHSLHSPYITHIHTTDCYLCIVQLASFLSLALPLMPIHVCK